MGLKCGGYTEGFACPECETPGALTPTFAADEPKRRGLTCRACGWGVRCDRAIEIVGVTEMVQRVEMLESLAAEEHVDESELRGLERELWESVLYTIASGAFIKPHHPVQLAAVALRTLDIAFDRDPDPLEFLKDVVRSYANMAAEWPEGERYLMVPAPPRKAP
jgi:hypothetical protein